MRATRVGGSLSSSARAFGAARQVRPAIHNRRAASRAIAVQSKPFLPVHFVPLMTNLPILGLDSNHPPPVTLGAPAERSYPLIASIGVEHQYGKEVALRSAFRWSRRFNSIVRCLL